MASPQVLSKAQYLAGLQCVKQLWWRAHEPRAPELVPHRALASLFTQARRVATMARRYLPVGLMIELPREQLDARIAATRSAIEAGAPVVYEAAFREDGVVAEIDVLVRDAGVYTQIEVRPSVRIKEEHLATAALQTHVARRAGVDVARVEIMHVNRACVHPDLSNLFVRIDVTAAVETLLFRIPAALDRQLAALAGPCPTVEIGEHCRRPRLCPFWNRCWPEAPPHHVGSLYLIGDRAVELEELGYRTIFDLPDDLPLAPHADRQRRAVQKGEIVVEPGLREALAGFQAPLAALDFETVGLAVPLWPGCRPFDAVPVQFSAHVESETGAIQEHAWIVEGPEDPRPELARRVVEACGDARAIVVYNAAFERACLEQLAQAAPEHAAALGRMAERLHDPLPVVRDFVYHPDFGGRFGLKAVLPALVPEARHKDLEIADGLAASAWLTRLVLDGDGLDPAERARMREALGRYCALDTLGLLRLIARLRELGETRA